MGVSHRGTVDNADGATLINGNLFFEDGSSNSALMGVYLTGNVCIGHDGSAVRDFVLRYCNVNSVQINNSECSGICINQNYIRSASNFGDSDAEITNNIMHASTNVWNGKILYNLIAGNISTPAGYSSFHQGLKNITTSYIIGNIFQTGFQCAARRCGCRRRLPGAGGI